MSNDDTKGKNAKVSAATSVAGGKSAKGGKKKTTQAEIAEELKVEGGQASGDDT